MPRAPAPGKWAGCVLHGRPLRPLRVRQDALRLLPTRGVTKETRWCGGMPAPEQPPGGMEGQGACLPVSLRMTKKISSRHGSLLNFSVNERRHDSRAPGTWTAGGGAFRGSARSVGVPGAGASRRGVPSHRGAVDVGGPGERGACAPGVVVGSASPGPVPVRGHGGPRAWKRFRLSRGAVCHVRFRPGYKVPPGARSDVRVILGATSLSSG